MKTKEMKTKEEIWKEKITEHEKVLRSLLSERTKINSKISYRRLRLEFLYKNPPNQLDLFQIEL